MNRLSFWGVAVVVLIGALGCSSNEKAATADASSAQKASSAAPQWAMNASIIEACSCPMFCQCYFNAEPSAHAGHGEHAAHGGSEHFCKFNNAYRVNKGHWGETKLDGAKFWLAGDLGGDFSKGQMDWAVLYFDKSVKPEQREAIRKIMAAAYPVKWNSFEIGPESTIEWKPGRDKAVAKLNGGQTAEIQLKRFEGMTSEPIVIRNLRYWGAPRNDGFILMPNEIQTLKVAPEGKSPTSSKAATAS